MLISYGIISDKNICKTLNIFRMENKSFCFFFLLYILKSEDRTYAGLANCAPNAERASSGAQNLKDVPDFPSSHIWLQKVNLQVFSRIGKTMKK